MVWLVEEGRSGEEEEIPVETTTAVKEFEKKWCGSLPVDFGRG